MVDKKAGVAGTHAGAHGCTFSLEKVGGAKGEIVKGDNF